MKKIEKIIFLIVSIATIVFIILSNIKDKNNEIKILTIATGYEICETEDNRFAIELYLTNKTDVLKYPEENIIVLQDKTVTNLITLDYESCEINDNTKTFNNNNYYLYTLVLKANGTSSTNSYFKRAYLNISNNIYKSNIYIGEVYIKNDGKNKLNIDKIYPIYNSYKGFKTMVGVVIKFSPEYSGKLLEDLNISSNFHSSNFIKLSEEISPSTPVTNYIPDYKLLDNNDTVPITIGTDDILLVINYTDLLLLNNTFLDIIIDGKSYTVMSMTYHNTNTELDVYKSIINVTEVDIL